MAVHGVGTLEEDRVDITAQQADQFVVAPAEAAHPKARRGAVDVLHLVVAVGAAVGVVHQLYVRDFQAFELEGVFQAAQGLGTGEVDLHVGPFRQAEAPVFQVAHAAHTALGGGQDQLHLVAPRQTQHPGFHATGVGPDRRDITAVAHRVFQVMVVMRLANFPFRGLAQRLDIGAKRQERLGQATGLHSNAKAGGNRAVGVPESIEWFAHKGLRSNP